MPITDSRETIIQRRAYPANIKGAQYDLYLSNYPVAAQYLADRIGDSNKVAVELCCGIGVTLAALASKFKKVAGVEIDPTILKYCRQNLENRGLLKKVSLIKGDILDEKVFTKIKADIAIYDIPYWVSKELPDGTNVLDKNPDLIKIINSIRKNITKNIVFFAPPWFSYLQAKRELGALEYQKIFINGKHDRNYIYLGNLIKTLGETEINLSL